MSSAMFSGCFSRFPKLDILVNNAGVQTWKALLDLEEAEWDRVIDTNLKGTFLCTQRAARHMKDSGGGRIINIGSGCNKVAFPHLVDYTASKGGIEMFTKVAAVELGQYRHSRELRCAGSNRDRTHKKRSRRLRGHLVKTDSARSCRTRPWILVEWWRFLASDSADFISGQTVWVDGGLFTKPAWPYE